jgi:hypothetical protein
LQKRLVKTTSFATTDLYTYGNSDSGEKKHQALYRAVIIIIDWVSTPGNSKNYCSHQKAQGMRIIPVITIKKRIRNRILKCGSDPKQERRRGKGNEDNADLMYKPPREESNMSIEEQTKKEPRETRPQTFPC